MADDRSGSVVDERGAVSPAEARFEARLRAIGLWLGPVAGGLTALLTHDLSTAQRTLSAIMVFCAVWWLTEPVPMAVTALVATAMAVVSGVAPARQAFAAFGNPLLFLFIGSFFIAEAIKVHGLGRRLAGTLARRARGRMSLVVALSASTCALSMWMSNVAATAIALPIAIAAAEATGDRKLGTALVLGVAWGASVGGLGTPVGTPPNLIGIGALREAGHHVGFLPWMALCVPLVIVMMLALWLLFAAVLGVRPGQPLVWDGGAPGGRVPWNRGEKAVVAALGAAIVGWLAPGLLEVTMPGAAVTRWVTGHVTEEVVALAAGCALFALPAGPAGPGGEPRRALTWSEATRIDWGVILLFGGGIMLGDLARTTGLAATWGETMVSWTGASSLWGMTALCIAAGIVLSEATSNTATATLVAPLAVALAQAAGVSPVPPALGATIGASFGFMLPISTGPNAMAYATGLVRVRQMVRAGIVFDVVGFAIILGGLRLLLPLLGLD
ncbi:MAG TPA: SLC13 family permease [Kofleriaceae bacterium]|nr:SLC13 family permease [Kofleriaceae bacterium]